jgi:hypothetical protein
MRLLKYKKVFGVIFSVLISVLDSWKQRAIYCNIETLNLNLCCVTSSLTSCLVKIGSGKDGNLPRKQSLAMIEVGDEVACTAKGNQAVCEGVDSTLTGEAGVGSAAYDPLSRVLGYEKGCHVDSNPPYIDGGARLFVKSQTTW